EIGGTNANDIAVFRSDKWSPLDNGLTLRGTVYAIAQEGTDVYVGGEFTQIDRKSVSHIAKYNTVTKDWEPLGSGANGIVYDIHSYQGDIYACGNFNEIGRLNVCGIAKWNGASW